jgi:hypothetical protein
MNQFSRNLEVIKSLQMPQYQELPTPKSSKKQCPSDVTCTHAGHNYYIIEQTSVPRVTICTGTWSFSC